MSLYSLHNQYPTPLPFRITLPNGFTRTDPSTFTESEIVAAGFTGPYEYPVYNVKIETIDWDGYQFIVRPYNSQELEEQWNKVRKQRNQLLKDSDWTQIRDYNLCLDNTEDWALYRQDLRNIPEVQSNPFDITWPSMPISQVLYVTGGA